MHVIVRVLLNTVLSLFFLSCGAVLYARDCSCTAQYSLLFCLSSFFLVVRCSMHVIVCVLLNTVLSLVFLSCGAVLYARDCSYTAQYCSVSRLSFLWCSALCT